MILHEKPSPVPDHRPLRWLPARLGRVGGFSTTRDFECLAGRDAASWPDALRPLLGDAPVAFASQVHGGEVAWVDAPCVVAGVDGLLTDSPGLALCVRTADCLPILIEDARLGIRGAVHAGWRGTMAGILGRALAMMAERGGRPEDWHLWIGPRIGGECYEVSPELAAEFAERFGVGVAGRMVDLPAINRSQAERAGVPASQIVDSGICTACECETFSSHRRHGARRGQVFTVILPDALPPNQMS